MEQIISYAWFFVGIVVYAVDALSDWLAAHGFSSGIVIIAIIGAYALNILDKWSIGIEERLQAIESKLGIERTPPIKKKYAWWTFLAWFVIVTYWGSRFRRKACLPLPLVSPCRASCCCYAPFTLTALLIKR